jgi:AraC family transcriptional regulator of arabinose operon
MHPNGLYRIHPASYTLIVTLEGEAVVNRGAEAFRAATGDALLCPPGVLLDCRLEGTGDWVHRWVAFQPRPMLGPLLAWPEESGGLRRLSVQQGDLWARIISCLKELDEACYRVNPPRRLDLCFNILEKILLWFEAANPQANPPAEDPRVLAATQYMARNYQRKLTVALLARQCELSPSRFAHLFRKVTGVTPMRYLEAIRLDHAETLLLSTEDTLARIAKACGFCNEFYLSSVFKRRFGQSPSRFRETATD